MIIIPKGADWPTYVEVCKISGMPVTKRRSFSTLFSDAISEWRHKSGCAPARIVIPIRFKRILHDQVMTLNFYSPSGEEDQFLGIPVIWSIGGAMELLGDVNP